MKHHELITIGLVWLVMGVLILPADARRVREQSDIQLELTSATNIVVLLLDGIQITKDDFEINKPWVYHMAQELIKNPQIIANFFATYLSSVAYSLNEDLSDLEQRLQKKDGDFYNSLVGKLKKCITISAGATTLHVFDQKLYQFLDDLLADKIQAKDYTLTVKDVCCSIGLEPYQIAAIIYDRLAFYAESIGENSEDFISKWDINIYAYDISMEALYMTGRGIYLASDSFFEEMFIRQALDTFKNIGNYVTCFEELPDRGELIEVTALLKGWVKPIYIDLADAIEIANVVLHPAELIIFSSPIAYPLVEMTATVNKYLSDFAFNKDYPGLLITGWGMYKEGLDYISISKDESI